MILNDNDCLAIFYILVVAGFALYLTALYEKFAKEALAKQGSTSKVTGSSETTASKGDQTTQPMESIQAEDGIDSSALDSSWQQVQGGSPSVEHFSDPICQRIFNLVGYHSQIITLLNDTITTVGVGSITHIVINKFLPAEHQFKLGDMPGLKAIRAISGIKPPSLASPAISFANNALHLQGIESTNVTSQRGNYLSTQTIKILVPHFITGAISQIQSMYPSLDTTIMGREAANRLSRLPYADVFKIYSLLLGPAAEIKVDGYLIHIEVANLEVVGIEARQLYDFLLVVIRSYSDLSPSGSES